MIAGTLVQAERESFTVGMGQVVVISHGQVAKTVLGSCIGLVLYDESEKTAAVAHIVLSESRGIVPSQPGKFADTAVNHMTRIMSSRGIPTHRLHAKIAGGANMFGSSGPMQIGKLNCDAVREQLENYGIKVAGEHVGGSAGRRIEFDSDDGSMRIEAANQSLAVL